MPKIKGTCSPKQFNASAYSLFALAGSSGHWRGCGLTPSRFCTKWLTAQTLGKAMDMLARKRQGKKMRLKNSGHGSPSSKQKIRADGVKAQWNSFSSSFTRSSFG